MINDLVLTPSMVESDQSPVNETKLPLFSATDNERFAIATSAERFAMMTICLLATALRVDAAQRKYFRTRDYISAAAAVSFSRRVLPSLIGVLLATFILASKSTTQIHFIDINATVNVE
jgi:hypothetical protein